jgi:flagellar motility protein MotE (MotC chaperone)
MNEEMELEALKEQMSETQIRDMAEIVAAEVRRREELKSNMAKPSGARPVNKSGVKNSRLGQGLPAEAVGEMYQDLNQRLVEIRQRKLQEKTAELESIRRSVVPAHVRRSRPSLALRLPNFGLSLMPPKKLAVLVAVVALGGLKVALSYNSPGEEGGSAPLGMLSLPAGGFGDGSAQEAVVNVNAGKAENQVSEKPRGEGSVQPLLVRASGQGNGQWSDSEKQVLLELDARRVELEKRREGLDRREAEIRNQSLALADRLGELKTLTMRLNQVRQERNVQYDSRMEQLANVYGSMAPNEAAPLIGRLDDQTALAILKKLPTKRMGQILSTMDADRAVRLTKSLTDGSQMNSNSIAGSQISSANSEGDSSLSSNHSSN